MSRKPTRRKPPRPITLRNRDYWRDNEMRQVSSDHQHVRMDSLLLNRSDARRLRDWLSRWLAAQ